MTNRDRDELKTAIDAHHVESKRLQNELRKHAAELQNPVERRRVETLLKAHEAMSDWFANDALACLPPTG